MGMICIKRADGGVSLGGTKPGVPLKTVFNKWKGSAKPEWLPATFRSTTPEENDSRNGTLSLNNPRIFRDSWEDTGTKIVHNMVKVRVIKTDQIRAERDIRLVATDVEVLKRDGQAVPAPLKAKRQALRDMPATVQDALDFAIVETAANTGLRLNVALNYGGRAELVDAVNTLLKRARQSKEVLSVTESTFSAELYTAGLPDPDLLIRTSGELRVSNFLLWQIAYAEIWVTDKLWPDFKTTDLLEAILDYQKRERRFGGLGAAEDQPEPDTELVPAGQGSVSGDSPPDLDDPSRLVKYSE